MDETLDHVYRPRIPWSLAEELTECGQPAAGKQVITRDAFIAKVRVQGKKRAGLSTCMTCWETAQRSSTWEQEPVRVITREIHAVGRARQERLDEFRGELLALAALVEAHPEEYRNFVEGLKDVGDLAKARKDRIRRAHFQARPRNL